MVSQELNNVMCKYEWNLLIFYFLQVVLQILFLQEGIREFGFL